MEYTYIQAIIAMLAVINPFACSLVLNKSMTHLEPIKIIKAFGIILIILVLSAFLGKSILKIFSITLDAFQIVGGIIIAFFGFEMLNGSRGETEKVEEATGASKKNMNSALTNLIIFGADPGTIVMVITLSATRDKVGIPEVALVGIFAAVVITAIFSILMFKYASRDSAWIDLITRFMGMIVVTIGLQFILLGLEAYFCK